MNPSCMRKLEVRVMLNIIVVPHGSFVQSRAPSSSSDDCASSSSASSAIWWGTFAVGSSRLSSIVSCVDELLQNSRNRGQHIDYIMLHLPVHLHFATCATSSIPFRCQGNSGLCENSSPYYSEDWNLQIIISTRCPICAGSSSGMCFPVVTNIAADIHAQRSAGKRGRPTPDDL